MNHFIDKHRAALGNSTLSGIEKDAMLRLLHFDWQGNIRQLENVIARAIVLAEHEQISIADLPPEIGGVEVSEDVDFAEDESLSRAKAQEFVLRNSDPALVPLFNNPDDIVTLEEVKERVFRRAWEVCDGNTSLAAKKLDIGRATAFRFVDQYGLKRESNSDT